MSKALSRKKLWRLIKATYGDLDRPMTEKQFKMWNEETFYFDVEFLEPIECMLSMSVTYSLLGDVESWAKNGIELRAYLPAGIKPALSATQIDFGYSSGKGNSNWVVSKKYPLELTESEFWSGLDALGDMAVDFIASK